MPGGIELAKAYVQVIPTTEGIEGSLSSALNKAGKSSGKSSGSMFAGAFKKAIGTGAAITAGVTAAVGGATAALTKAVGGVAEYGDTIDKNSQKMGVSSKFYQEWDAVLQHSGTSMESMTSTFKTLSKASQKASEDQQGAFEKLGLSMEQVSSMSTEDLFTTVITALQNMEEGTERTYLATTLLGKGGQQMGALLNTSAADTQAMIDKVNELGGVMSESAVKDAAAYQDSLQDMTTAMDSMKRNVLAEFMPGLTQIMDGITGFIAGDEGSLDSISSGINDLATKAIDALPEIVDAMTQIIAGLAKTIVDNLPKIIEAGVKLFISLIANLPTIIIEIVKAVPQIIKGIVAGFKAAWPQLKEAGKQLLKMIGNGIIAAKTWLKEKITSIKDSIVNWFKALPDKIKSVGKNLIEGLWNGIKDKLQWLKDKISGFASSVLDSIKSFFGVHSPSTETKWIGQMLDEGLAVGVSGNEDKVTKQAKKVTDDVLQEFRGANAELNSVLQTDFSIKKSAKVSMEQKDTANQLNEVIRLLNKYLPDIGGDLYLDGDTLVGRTAKKMDKALGDLYVKSERRVYA